MVSTDLINRLFRQGQESITQTASFRPGQIFSGRVIKHFPNQTAEVQAGGQTLYAQLETALSTNERYWFQVQPGEGKVHLKVLESSGSNGKPVKASMEGLLNQLSLPATKENTAFANYFLRERLPFTPEILKLTSQWLTGSQSTEVSLQAIKEILTRQLPFTKEVFLSISAVVKNESVTSLLGQLQSSIHQGHLTEAGMNTSALIDQLKLTQQEIRGLNTEKVYLQQGKMLQSTEVNEEIKLTGSDKGLPSEIINENKSANIVRNEASELKEQMKSMIKTIGYSFENEITQKFNGQEALEIKSIEVLKPLLMKLIKEEASSQIQENAEKLLHKITGFQLLSQDVGPVLQQVFQIPLSFWDKTQDVTMQWSGRKTENGQIDPNYCRVLFYLNLDHLNETIVDVHVQNRVMNIKIINEQDSLSMLASPLTSVLKEKLAELNYYLSSVSFEKPAETDQMLSNQPTRSLIMSKKPFSGVDLRI